MQIILFALSFLALFTYIIYKINNRFGTKEGIILIATIAISAVVFNMYSKNQDNVLPTAFKNKYFIENNIKIEKLSSTLLNNKNISSKNNFIYKFTYIINKENQQFLCTAPKVEIKRIEDEFVFINFANLKEECVLK